MIIIIINIKILERVRYDLQVLISWQTHISPLNELAWDVAGVSRPEGQHPVQQPQENIWVKRKWGYTFSQRLSITSITTSWKCASNSSLLAIDLQNPPYRDWVNTDTSPKRKLQTPSHPAYLQGLQNGPKRFRNPKGKKRKKNTIEEPLGSRLFVHTTPYIPHELSHCSLASPLTFQTREAQARR